MDIMEPVHGTAYLLSVAAIAVALLLVLIMKVKLHAFLSLVLVSLLTAVAAGIPLGDVPDTLLTGFGGTLGSVALLVALGVMLGRLLERTGGAQVLADTLIARFGEKRAPFALGVAALIFGFPIFFDAGLVIFLPIIFSVARRFGGSILLYALPTAGAFAAMHAIVPPHPGPVAAADLTGGDIGLTLILGVPVAVVAWFVGSYLVGTRLGRRFVTTPAALFGDAEDADAPTYAPPRFIAVLGVLLFPLILICLNTGVSTLQTAGAISEDAPWADALILLGQTPVALLLTVLLSLVVLAPGRFSVSKATALMDDALGPVCAIILITGAGGMFGGVLRASGIGASLTESLSDLGFSLILQAFLIAAALRVAQGSATVALTTTAGLVSAQVAEVGLGNFDIALLVFAIAAGATVLSHVNDSGFWLVSRFFGMDEKTTLKTWTVMETTLGLAVFALASLLWVVF
ncbi:permease [Rhodococcus sp. Leaf7]|uniref:GntP family permease n=1 Tax=unclassified Rhodococcus (in: high G+C Gram-positive bacteria) TaxID=192944 RepID=UPI0006FF5571|nr:MULTISPECIES: GntP family permease [unclassified Rhodococcus (in: high G+C Gram-positive bacteria)]KQU07658.1 permease [Rhodococcus sp. Leaf7]KQU43178.1 permease [Rhodococcus sp. Leaf247]